MSKHDFTPAEFADRLARLRTAMGAAGLDWLLVMHPVSIRWLIGQDTKSYTVFQCLPVSAKPDERPCCATSAQSNDCGPPPSTRLPRCRASVGVLLKQSMPRLPLT